MKCFNLILDFSNFFKNYGEIIMIFLLLFFLAMMIIYFIFGNKQIHNYLANILKMSHQKEMENNNNTNNNTDNNNIKYLRTKSNEVSTINSEDKEIVINPIKIRKKPLHKKSKFNIVKAPPKKPRRNSELFSVVNINMGQRKRNSQIIQYINNFNENKSETLETVLGNKQYKKK